MKRFIKSATSWRRTVLLWIIAPVLSLTLPLLVAFYSLFQGADASFIDEDFAQNEIAFVALGDQGTGNFRQWQVGRSMDILSESNPLDFVVLLGDNFYARGVTSVGDIQWRYKFENMYQGNRLSHIPYYAVLGNHDYLGNELAEIEYGIQRKGSGRWRMPAKDYVVYYGEARGLDLIKVIYLDTSPAARDIADTAQKLVELLDNSKPTVWTFVASHVPIKTGSEHYFDPQIGKYLLPILNRYSVDIYFNGHEHNQQLVGSPAEFMLTETLPNEYAPGEILTTNTMPSRTLSSNTLFSNILSSNTRFVISGTGGKHGAPLDGGFEPNLVFSDDSTGFVYVKVNSSQLELRYLDQSGTVLFETYFSPRLQGEGGQPG
ncbi:MAG: hypothetical protein ACJAR0_000980 [Candidatus Azotimanducaceae bacterium]